MSDELLQKLERLARLKEQGILTETEFETQKAALLQSQETVTLEQQTVARNPLLDAPEYAEPVKHKRSSTFGIIATVVGLLAYMTPKIFLSIVLIALAAFVIIGFIRDGSKIFSTLGLLLGLGIIYMLFKEASNEQASYTIRYEVSCFSCDVNYTNPSGGSDQDKNGGRYWTKTITAQGDQFLSLSAQNKETALELSAKIYVNDVLVASESATGEYAMASVNCRPADVNSK